MYIPPFCKRSQLGPEGALYPSPPSRALSSFPPRCLLNSRNMGGSPVGLATSMSPDWDIWAIAYLASTQLPLHYLPWPLRPCY